MRLSAVLTLPVLSLSLACASPSPPAAADSPGTPAPADAKAGADAAAEPGAPEGAPSADAAGSPIAEGAKAELGKPAPDFQLVDLAGKTQKLSDHAGKIVVLEWFNPECPFVNYAHSEGPLVKMASEMTSQGVVWLAINSNAPGKQGHDPAVNGKAAEKFGMTHPILRDETGAVGKAYGAEKTPHIFLIDTDGALKYAGGIDNAPMGEVDGDDPKRNHLAEALTDLRAGKPVRVPTAPPWGCTVKYG
jgi:peroxiredoxin